MSARAKAIVIAFATIAPLALVHGIIALTATIQFGPAGAIRDLGTVTEAARQHDVLRALGLGLLFHATLCLSLLAPYVSIAHSYAGKHVGTELFLDIVLRRAFLLSLPWALLALAAWLSPASVAEAMPSVLLVLLVGCYFVVLRELKRAVQLVAELTEPFAWLLVVVSLVVHLLVSVMVFSKITEGLPSQSSDATVSLSADTIPLGS